MKRIFLPQLSPLLLLIVLFIPLLIGFLIVNVINTAFTKLGFSPLFAFAILFFSLVGSMINIPLKKNYRQAGRESFFSEDRVPIVEKTGIAVNVGGAVIPLGVSAFLVLRSDVPLVNLLIAIIIVSAVCYHFARPIPRLGISIPLFIPPIVSAVVAMVLSHTYAPIIAYVSGVLGVLIGADLLNLPQIENLGAPMASIGGAGTFDGIFLTGIISVLLV
jgi:uncharacterized membrane protein